MSFWLLLLRVCYEFFLVGLFSVGGGLATLPFLYNIANTTGWYTAADVANMVAIAESTPGAIGINMATYAGYITTGVLGGICATLGLITPSIIIILVIARVLDKFQGNKLVQDAFLGLRPASIALVVSAGVSVAKITLVNWAAPGGLENAGAWLQWLGGLFVWKALLLGVVLYVAQRFFKKIHPIVFLAASAVVGILFHFGA